MKKPRVDTGRFSSFVPPRGPNLQNIPIRSATDGVIRTRIRELFEKIVRPTPIEQFVAGLREGTPLELRMREIEYDVELLEELRKTIHPNKEDK